MQYVLAGVIILAGVAVVSSQAVQAWQTHVLNRAKKLIREASAGGTSIARLKRSREQLNRMACLGSGSNQKKAAELLVEIYRLVPPRIGWVPPSASAA